MSATSPAPAPTRPRLTPPRPRLVADIGVAALAFIAFGLPSILLAPQPWHVEFFLFGTQSLLSADSPGTVATVIRTAINLAAAIGMPVAVIWRASKPVHSTAVVAALALAHFFTGVLLMPVDFLIFLSLYSLTIYASSAASRIGLFTALFGGLLVTISIAPIWGGLESAIVGGVLFLLAAMLVLLSWGAGLLRRSRLEQRESLRERALRLERERDQQAQIATVAERNRIAREMHDIVAHSLSVVVAQADGGRYAAAADPEAATRALETIAETSRAALADMRRILGVLRDENGETADLIPQPADADIDALIGQVKTAGLNVSHVTLGAPRALPPGAGVALYRIVQESLTNILKHGGPEAAAIVTTEWKTDGLTISIDDDGRGAAAKSDGAGHGLVGMRERAAMLGGSLAAGPKPGGGFRVRCHIPLPNSGPGLQ
ncbi:MAG TPA: sensor histidine kinase [Beutenbergiaceae bacterium]|nr:sensor histidine kinase [Beutenbergiaceae bacterium]